VNRWISEKMDGVRAFWNGVTLISKHGKRISCPEWFTDSLPRDNSLDGELWLGRGTFELLNGLVSSKEDDLSWKNISYVVYDLPWSSEPYEIRIRDMANMTLPNHTSVVDVERCRGKEHLHRTIVKITETGGEGLMVNKPGSGYQAIRTESLLKIKVPILQDEINISSVIRR
jgi:DNA ligase-1